MFKKIERINEVYLLSYTNLKSIFHYFNRNELVYIDYIKNSEKKINISRKYKICFITDKLDEVILYDFEKRNSILLTIKNEKISIEENIYIKAIDEDSKLYYDLSVSENEIFFENSKGKINLGKLSRLILKNSLCFHIGYHNNFIDCFESNGLKWKIDEPLLGTHINSSDLSIKSEIYFYRKNIYFFICDRYDYLKSATLCIDIKTGELVQKIPELKGDLYLDNNYLYTINWESLGEKEGNYGSSRIIWEQSINILNIENFELKKINLTEILNEHNLLIDRRRFIVKDNLLIFVHEKSTSEEDAIVGVIDLSTLELKWKTHFFYGESPLANDGTRWIEGVKLAGNKLYIQEASTLHIFEKE